MFRSVITHVIFIVNQLTELIVLTSVTYIMTRRVSGNTRIKYVSLKEECGCFSIRRSEHFITLRLSHHCCEFIHEMYIL